MYLECTEGEINADWKVNEPVDFHTFRDILSRQMLNYDPKNERYPGDSKMKIVTQLSRKRRYSSKKESSKINLGMECASMGQYRQAIQEKRFCEDLALYKKHLCSLKTTKHGVNFFAMNWPTRNASHAKYPYIILIGRGRFMARTASCSIIRRIILDCVTGIAVFPR